MFFDPAVCLPPDRMHQADQGIFKSILSWTVQMLEDMAMAKGGGILMNTKINEMNRRFQALVPFTDMKVFNHGVSHLTGLNAFEYRDMMKSCVVVFKGNQHKAISYDTILCHMTGIFADLDSNVDKAVTRVFTEYTNWYMMLRIEEHCEATLGRLDQAGKTLLLSLKTFTSVSGPLSKVSQTYHVMGC